MLETSGLTYRIKKQTILEDVGFQITEGESLAIIGPNGAGKSTLLKCLGRILKPAKGEVRLNNRLLETYTAREFAHLVSFMPQAQLRAIPFSVREFVAMSRYAYLAPFSSLSKSDHEAVQRALEVTRTTEYALRRVSTLSGGEQQKVMIASILAQEAKILLLDEPATFLDPGHQEAIHGVLARVRCEAGVSLVVVSHDANSACMLCDRVLGLKNGKIVFDGSSEAALQEGVLETIYDVPFVRVRHPLSGRQLALPRNQHD